MPRRKKKKIAGEDIPVASFSDIAFLLIIFFILVTSLHKDEGFITEIPAGEKSEAKSEKNTTIAIRNDKLFINDKDVSTKELYRELKELKLGEKKTEDEKMVMLEAIGNVSYQNYYAAMSAISSAGGIVAIVKEDESSP